MEVLNTVEYEKVTGDYYLVTLHRQENVDNPARLSKFVESFNSLDRTVHWPVHPRTRKQLEGFELKGHVLLHEPMGFSEFVRSERAAYCVLTDSGTVQEECAIYGVPCVTLRDSTERPETIESGSNFIAGTNRIMDGIKAVTSMGISRVPQEYKWDNVSDTVVNIVLGHYA